MIFLEIFSLANSFQTLILIAFIDWNSKHSSFRLLKLKKKM